jgi:hypothetical protein
MSRLELHIQYLGFGNGVWLISFCDYVTPISSGHINVCPTPIKKKIKFSSYIRKFRVEQLQSLLGFLIYEEAQIFNQRYIYEEAVSHS